MEMSVTIFLKMMRAMAYVSGKINLKNFDNTLVYDSTDENIENYFGMIQKQKKYEEYFNDAEDTKWFL